MNEEFSWEVVLPQRGASLGGQPPKASVRVCGSDAGIEYVPIPASVGRSLARLQASGEHEVSCGQDLYALIAKTTKRVARERVSRLIERRDYAKREVRERLRREGFDRAVIDEVVDRAVETGLVSDERFADAFIRGKVSAGWGMDRIVRELSRRGVDVSDLKDWPYAYLDPEDEYARAVEAASKKTVRNPNAYAKLVRFLVGRGYSYGVATRAAKETLASS